MEGQLGAESLVPGRCQVPWCKGAKKDTQPLPCDLPSIFAIPTWCHYSPILWMRKLSPRDVKSLAKAKQVDGGRGKTRF